MRRGLYWLGVLSGVVLLAGGVVIGALGYAKTSGPDGAVRGYFDAIARADAANALAFGDLPDAPHTLLTATVLREQQRIAPLRGFTILATHHNGSTATVDVRYTLAFASRAVPINVSVPVHQSNGGWRLDRSAIATELKAIGGRERESIVGAGIPAGPTLLFPGALPIRLDTPYLRLDPGRDNVSFDALSTTEVYLEVTDAGRTAALDAVRGKLRRCVTGPADITCPLPDDRYVPGSVHGSIKGVLQAPTVLLDSLDPVGTLHVKAGVTVSATYRRLDFHNRQVAGHGDVELAVHAVAFAVPPLSCRWSSS